METSFFRLLFLYCVFIVTLFISWIIITIVQCVLFIILKPINANFYRKINYYLLYVIYCQMLCLSTWFSKIEIYVHTDQNNWTFLGKEHACVIMNHFYEIDWLFIGTLANEVRVLPNFKPFIKKAVQYIPFIGWSLYISDYIMLERSYAKDKEVIQRKTAELLSYPDPTWTIFWPEGTRYTEIKHEQSLEYAREKSLPLLKHHLIPRSKGFLTSIPVFRNKLGALYDVVLSVNPKDETELTATNVLLGKNIKAHLYVRRIPMEDVPDDERQATEFLINMFVEKDKVQDRFFNTGSYFSNSEAENIKILKLERKYMALVTSLAWMILIVPPFWYYLIATFLSTMQSAIYISIGIFCVSILGEKVLKLNQAKNE